MNNSKKIKLTMVLALAGLCAVGLSSCSKTKTSSINYDSTYASTTDGKYSITNGELWEELKWNATDVISTKLNDVVLKDARAEVNRAIAYINGTETDLEISRAKLYLDYLESQSLSGVFSVTEFDNVYIQTEKELKTHIQKYIDTAYVNDGTVIEYSQLEPDNLKANAKTLFAGTRYETTYYMWTLFDDYLDTCAQKVLSFWALEDEIADYNEDKSIEDDDMYYSKNTIASHYRSEYLYSSDRQAILIKFTNAEEITSTLKAFGVKVYNSTFYFIPQGSMTNTEYSSYYDDFDCSSPSTSEKCFNMNTVGGDSLIFEFYVEMYNYIYTYRESLVSSVGGTTNTTTHRRDITDKLVAKYITQSEDDVKTPEQLLADMNLDEEYYELYINYTQEDLNEIDSDYKTYISGTLKVNPDIVDGETRYSTEGKNYNNGYYMAFKISEDELPSYYEFLKDPDKDDILDGKDEFLKEMICEIMWDELTDSQISEDLSDEISNCKLYIYDEDVEIAYSANNSSYSKTHKNAPSSDTLFTIVYNKEKTNVTISETFNELESTSGVTTAIDLLSRKVIKDTSEYADTAKNISTYNDTLELLLTYFANGQLDEYDETLGKYNFLKLYFHSSDVDTIIDNYYRLNEASSEIITNYGNNQAFYAMVQKYAKIAYDYSYKVSASNVVVYVDMDDDSDPDTDFDWTTTVYNSTETYADLAKELINKVITYVKNSTETESTALSTIVEEIEGSQRFTNGIDQYNGDGTVDYDPTEPETRWAKYKRAGLHIKIDEYTDVTNTTEELTTGEDGMVSLSIKTRMKELFDTLSEHDTYPSQYMDSSSYENGGDGWLIETGYAMLVITSVTENGSAKFTSNDDANSIFTNLYIKYNDEIKLISSLYNDSDSEATIDQITFFILTYLTYESTDLFPSNLTDYITDYVKPIYEKYTDSSSQRELLLSKLLGGDINFATESNNEKFDKIRAINQRISDDYLEKDDKANVFPDWWTEIMNVGDGE